MRGARDGRRRGIRMSRFAAVLAPLVLSLVPPAADAAPTSSLAATTVFTATTASTTTVRVPRPASLIVTNSATSPNIDVSSARGRLAGFTITAARPTTPEPPTLVAMQVGMCSQQGCRPTAPNKFTEYATAYRGLPRKTLEGNTQQVTLPAGDYIVRAVTDGAPVQMTLRLQGLSGKTAVRLTRPFSTELRTDTSNDGVAGVKPLRNVDASHEFASNHGLMMDVWFLTAEPHVRSEYGYCLYRGDAKPPTGYYHPECPGAETGEWVDFGQPTTQFAATRYGSDIALLSGRWTRGYYATAVGGASSLTAVTLWVDLV